jgi:pyroglutamyl-peptidase
VHGDLVTRLGVLLTGFGPFPGVARNASAALAGELACLARRRHPQVQFFEHVLPVDWNEAPLALSQLLLAHRPAIALHFGVSARATGFVLETLARNITTSAPDVSGRHAASDILIAGDRPQRTTTLPVRRILRSLVDAGYPAHLSQDAGRYLCNAVMFHSLRHAVRAIPGTRAGFIHIPATLDPGVQGEPSQIGWGEAIDGGLRSIDVCVAPFIGATRTRRPDRTGMAAGS